MLRGIVVAIGVSVMLLGGILPAQAEDRDRDDDDNNKGGHRAILNAVTSGNTAHGQLSSKITALSGGHQGILDAVTGGTSSSNAAHTTLQSEHVTQNTAHSTFQSEHAAQETAHQGLSNKIEDVQKAVDALSGGGGGTTDLRGVSQNWDKTLPANDPGGACPSNSSRFTCVMGGEAVRDNETGLVWEMSPAPVPSAWVSARFQCTARVTGGRKGWRLPSFAELSSLVDPSVGSPGPTLPSGHPFSNVQSARYWAASTDAGFPTGAWGVDFRNGDVGTLLKTFTGPVWCVRGGMNADQY